MGQTLSDQDLPRDIDYFTESRMNCQIKTFRRKIPKSFRTKFEEMLIFCLADDVLQGYQGPSHFRDGSSGDSHILEAVDGVQEIQFWYGVSKNYNYFPVFGTIVYLIIKPIENSNGSSDWKSLYFDEASGSIISSSKANDLRKRNKTANNLFTKGVSLESQEKYENAFNAYEEAFDNTTVNKQKFLTHKDNVREKWADKLFDEGLNLMKSSNFMSAINKFEAAAAKTKDETKKNKIEKKIVEAKQLQARNKAEELFVTGEQLWNNARTAEENGDSDDATKNFQKACSIFKEALELEPSNLKYKKFVSKSKLKIEGNKIFNEGVEMLKKANKLHQKHMYQEARNKLVEARSKFQQGYDFGNDQRFKDCIDLVQESIDEVNQKIKAFQLTAGMKENTANNSDDSEETVGFITSK
jgi:tetratricopeptide (TPR) repeat protein